MENIKNYDLSVDEQHINQEIAKIKEAIKDGGTIIEYVDILSMIDLTTLKETDNECVIEGMCVKVNAFKSHYPGLKNVAAICVYPAMVEYVKKHLKVEGINIASVGGGFPASQTFLEIKTKECKMAVDAGADEIDIVIPVGPFLTGEDQMVYNETNAIKKAIGNAHLKVILETGKLSAEKIRKASLLAMEAGADFIKTSTGKVEVSATHEAMYIMCEAIKDFYTRTGKKIGIKPAGGISEAGDALVYYKIVEQVLGQEWLNNEMFRFGASRLANSLISKINQLKGDKTGVDYF